MAKDPRGSHSGAFKPGQSGNPDGRPKGAVNKVTRQFKELMQKLIDDNADNIQSWIERVAKDDPKGALDTLLKGAEFAAPKLSRTELVGDAEGNPILVKRLVDDIGGRSAQSAPSPEIPSDPRGSGKEGS